MEKLRGILPGSIIRCDWLYEMQRQGFLEDVTRNAGGFIFL